MVIRTSRTPTGRALAGLPDRKTFVPHAVPQDEAQQLAWNARQWREISDAVQEQARIIEELKAAVAALGAQASANAANIASLQTAIALIDGRLVDVENIAGDGTWDGGTP